MDWARYGEVVRSVEEVQTALVRELLGLLNIRYHDRVPISVDLHDHAHLGEGKHIFSSSPKISLISRLYSIRHRPLPGLHCGHFY